MPEYRQYGVAVRTLSDYVDRFCLKQGNVREAYYIRALVMAEDIWKDLYRNTIWTLQRAVLQVDHRKHTVKIPDNCERVINISVIDHHNKLHPLSENSDYNTTEILCSKSNCSCQNCHGENTLCPAIDNLTVSTEYITIKGVQYPQTTWIRYNPDGSLQQEQTIPGWNTATGNVTYTTQFTTLCNLEVTDKGCIKPTKPNIDLLYSFTGWDGLSFAWGERELRPIIPTERNYWGEYNYNANNPQIIQIFRHEHHDHHFPEWNEIKNVILTFKTNGDAPGKEILIPEYAQKAMDAGIIWQQKSLNPRDSDRDDQAYRKYRREKSLIFRYLNPVTMVTMQQLQQAPHRW